MQNPGQYRVAVRRRLIGMKTFKAQNRKFSSSQKKILWNGKLKKKTPDNKLEKVNFLAFSLFRKQKIQFGTIFIQVLVLLSGFNVLWENFLSICLIATFYWDYM